jgi:hypothetical protein
MKPSPEFNLMYTIGFFLQLLGLCLLTFSIYLIPHVFFGLIYPLPEAVFAVEWWLDVHGNSAIYHVFIVFMPFFLSSLLCFFEARNLTKRIEKQLLGQDEISLAEQVKVHYSEGASAIVRVILSVSVVFLIFWLLTRVLS